MREGEVYLCPCGRQDAAGPDQLVPVVVLTREALNRSGPVVRVAPLIEGARHAPRAPGAVWLRTPAGGLTTDSGPSPCTGARCRARRYAAASAG